MVQQSCAILLPCGVNVFGGVEFVCCPKDKSNDKYEDRVYKDDDKSELLDTKLFETVKSTELESFIGSTHVTTFSALNLVESLSALIQMALVLK